MIRTIPVFAVLLLVFAGYLAFGFLPSGTVYAFTPTTKYGSGPLELSLNGANLHIDSDDSGSACLPIHIISLENEAPLRIPSDLLDGQLVSASTCDLDEDGNLELALVARACGSGAYLQVLLLERENEQWVQCNAGSLPAVMTAGYMGHGEVTFSQKGIQHRYPIYKDGDSNVRPSGGERSVEYHLKHGILVKVASLETPSR